MSEVNIHPTACVDPGAELASDVKVGPFAVIGPDTKIGAGSNIGPHVVIHPHTTMGPGCRVHAGAVVGDDPQDLAFSSDTISYVRIGANCTIRECVTIHRGTKPESATIMGDNCFLMACSHVAHNVRMGNNVILANNALLAGYVQIDDRVFVSGHSGVHQFVHIGRLVMVSGLAGITKDVPPFCTVKNSAMNQVQGLNVVGMRRAGIGPEDRKMIKRAYRLLYESNLNVSQALEQAETEFPTGPAREFFDFIKTSKRGICGKGK